MREKMIEINIPKRIAVDLIRFADDERIWWPHDTAYQEDLNALIHQLVEALSRFDREDRR